MFTFGVASVSTVCAVSLVILLALLYVFFRIARLFCMLFYCWGRVT